jgi:hypothetical protein
VLQFSVFSGKVFSVSAFRFGLGLSAFPTLAQLSGFKSQPFHPSALILHFGKLAFRNFQVSGFSLSAFSAAGFAVG